MKSRKMFCSSTLSIVLFALVQVFQFMSTVVAASCDDGCPSNIPSSSLCPPPAFPDFMAAFSKTFASIPGLRQLPNSTAYSETSSCLAGHCSASVNLTAVNAGRCTASPIAVDPSVCRSPPWTVSPPTPLPSSPVVGASSTKDTSWFMPAVIGGPVGGFVLLLAIVLLIVCVCRRQRNIKRKNNEFQQFQNIPSPLPDTTPSNEFPPDFYGRVITVSREESVISETGSTVELIRQDSETLSPHISHRQEQTDRKRGVGKSKKSKAKGGGHVQMRRKNEKVPEAMEIRLSKLGGESSTDDVTLGRPNGKAKFQEEAIPEEVTIVEILSSETEQKSNLKEDIASITKPSFESEKERENLQKFNYNGNGINPVFNNESFISENLAEDKPNEDVVTDWKKFNEALDEQNQNTILKVSKKSLNTIDNSVKLKAVVDRNENNGNQKLLNSKLAENDIELLSKEENKYNSDEVTKESVENMSSKTTPSSNPFANKSSKSNSPMPRPSPPCAVVIPISRTTSQPAPRGKEPQTFNRPKIPEKTI